MFGSCMVGDTSGMDADFKPWESAMDEIVMVVRAMEPKRIRLAPGAKERRDNLSAEERCLGCKRKVEDGERVTCGLCVTCYQSARHFIRKGRVTAEALIREGKMLPPRTGGPKPVNPFTKELSER